MNLADLSDPTFWIPTLISLVAVVLFYIDMRRREEKDREASHVMLDLIRTMRKELKVMRVQKGIGNVTQQELLKKEQMDWNMFAVIK